MDYSVQTSGDICLYCKWTKLSEWINFWLRDAKRNLRHRVSRLSLQITVADNQAGRKDLQVCCFKIKTTKQTTYACGKAGFCSMTMQRRTKQTWREIGFSFPIGIFFHISTPHPPLPPPPQKKKKKQKKNKKKTTTTNEQTNKHTHTHTHTF